MFHAAAAGLVLRAPAHRAGNSHAWSILDCLRLWNAAGWRTADGPDIPFVLKPFQTFDEVLRDFCANQSPPNYDGLLARFLELPTPKPAAAAGPPPPPPPSARSRKAPPPPPPPPRKKAGGLPAATATDSGSIPPSSGGFSPRWP